MKQPNRHRSFCRTIGDKTVVLFVTVLISGCNVSENEKLTQVSGSITVDGKPAEGATLLFHPDGAPTSTVASGTAGSDGKFTLISDMKPGIATGSFKVSVVWPDPKVKPTERQMMSGSSVDAPDLLKGRYASRDKTPLRVEITDSTKELPPFELKTR